jgi:hypothetical protein
MDKTELARTRPTNAPARRGVRRRLGLAICGSLAVMLPAVAAADIIGHRAVYTLSLNRVVGDSNVADARGVFAVEWTDNCDGWAVEQSYSLHVAYHEQPDQLISSRYTTWEAKDGLSYTFDVVTTRSGRRAERVQGTAEIDPETHAGSAQYVEPRGLQIRLPEGSMFPAAHTEELLSRAGAGERLWPAIVFDGANVDQPLLINAAFGGPVEAAPVSEAQPAAAGQTDLTSVGGWRVRMAVFAETTRGEEPDYEIQMDLLNNGVARMMQLDYGEFVLDADLRVIEPTPAPQC